MTTSPGGFDSIAALVRALAAFDDPSSSKICADLVQALHESPQPLPEGEAAALLVQVRRSRRFDLLLNLADTLMNTGLDIPVVRRQYAQGLIEQGYLFAALTILQDLVQATTAGDHENAEAHGLMGRAHKELFLLTGGGATSRRTHLLQAAIADYAVGYSWSRNHVWHGVNLAALLLRADRESITLAGRPDPGHQAREIATEVIDTIEARGSEATDWDWATLFEANLALGQLDAALRWLGMYLKAPELGAFEVGSLMRQLTTVWQLTADTEPGRWVLPPVQTTLIQKQGGSLAVGVSDSTAAAGEPAQRRASFEKVFGADGIETQRWFETLLQRCRGIVRIEDSFDDGLGTGFLVAGPELNPAWPPVVLITNAHVIPDAVAPADAVVTFRGLPAGTGDHRAGITRILKTSPASEFDVTIAELDRVPAAAVLCPLAPRLPSLGAQPPARVYVIGHPLGAPTVKISIQDNHLLDYDDTHVHYRAPTEPGNSGSPVFDNKLNVVALHHAGDEHMSRLHGNGTYQANEGIRIDRIRQALGQLDHPVE